jgi:pyridoxal 5'-phosphate synthase pdxT subunit
VKVGVLGLQGDVREHVAALESLGAASIVVKDSDALDDIAGLIIPGGESTTIGKLLDRYGMLDPLRDRARAGLPLYGTCAGFILMARDVVGNHPAEHRLGVLDVTVRRNAYGRQVDSFEADLSVTGLDERFPAVFIRAPAIETVGSEVEVLAEHAGAPVMVRQERMVASSFHPEMTSDRRIHELFLDVIG